MLSLPVQLTAGPDGGIRVTPHPDVDTLREKPLRSAGGAVDLAGEDADGVADLELTLPAGARLRLETADRPVVLTAADTGLVVESVAGTARVPVAAGSAIALRVVVDRGAVEAWTGDGRWLALRLPHLHAARAVLAGAGELAGWRLDPVQAPG
jgi:hypothetical protein